MLFVLEVTVKMEQNGSDVPVATGYMNIAWKKCFLMIVMKNDFVLTNFSHHNFFLHMI